MTFFLPIFRPFYFYSRIVVYYFFSSISKHRIMKSSNHFNKRGLCLWLLLFPLVSSAILKAQPLEVSPELKSLILTSIGRDHKIISHDIDSEIAVCQRNAIRMSYLPKIELGGKYLYVNSVMDSKLGDITGFEGASKLQEFMNSPSFPAMFPQLAGLGSEITALQQLLVQQGLVLPSLTKDLSGDFSGSYGGIDMTAKMLLFSGGQVPNLSRALSEKVKAQQSLSEKSTADVISEVVSVYDQLALLNQSKKVLEESARRLEAEKRFASSALSNGLATDFDTLKIAVARAALEAKIASYEGKKILLTQKLAQLTGKQHTEFSNLQPVLEPAVLFTGNETIENRAELKALKSGVQAQRYLIKAEKSHYLPKIQAVASVRYDALTNASTHLDAPLAMGIDINNLTMGPTVLAGVGFRWELFDRSSGSTRVKQARLELRKAENALEEAREMLELNQVKASAAYESSNAQLIWKEKQKTAALRALELANKSYKEGMLGITERLSAETEVQIAELEYLQAIYDQRQATLDCYKATGSLTLNNIR